MSSGIHNSLSDLELPFKPLFTEPSPKKVEFPGINLSLFGSPYM